MMAATYINARYAIARNAGTKNETLTILVHRPCLRARDKLYRKIAPLSVHAEAKFSRQTILSSDYYNEQIVRCSYNFQKSTIRLNAMQDIFFRLRRQFVLRSEHLEFNLTKSYDSISQPRSIFFPIIKLF